MNTKKNIMKAGVFGFLLLLGSLQIGCTVPERRGYSDIAIPVTVKNLSAEYHLGDTIEFEISFGRYLINEVSATGLDDFDGALVDISKFNQLPSYLVLGQLVNSNAPPTPTAHYQATAFSSFELFINNDLVMLNGNRSYPFELTRNEKDSFYYSIGIVPKDTGVFIAAFDVDMDAMNAIYGGSHPSIGDVYLIKERDLEITGTFKYMLGNSQNTDYNNFNLLRNHSNVDTIINGIPAYIDNEHKARMHFQDVFTFRVVT